jgi:hypothetical protein
MDRPSLPILDMYQTKLIPAAEKVDQTLEGQCSRPPERSRTTHAAARAVRANETFRKDVTLIKNAVANLAGTSNASTNNLTRPKIELLSFS